MSMLARCFIAAGAVAIVVALITAGLKGALGLSAGIVGALVNLYGWWRIIGLTSSAIETRRGRSLGASFIVLLFFAKLPIFIALAFAISKLGRAPLGCFLIGVGLVYCALVGWSFVPRRGDP